jgi:hypothetical protein
MITRSNRQSQNFPLDAPYVLITWLRCRTCHRGYFASAPPTLHPCPACAGGHLQPVSVWDLRHEAAPAGMVVGQHGLEVA